MKYWTAFILLLFSIISQSQDEMMVVDIASDHVLVPVTIDESLIVSLSNRTVSFFHRGQTLLDYIATHFEYPEIAKENSSEGMAKVRFIVDEEGRVVEPVMIQSIQAEIDIKIIEFIKEMPDWIPRIRKGRRVPSTVVVPFVFNLK